MARCEITVDSAVGPLTAAALDGVELWRVNHGRTCIMGDVVDEAGSGTSVLVGHWCATRPQQRVAALALSDRHEDAVVLAKDLWSAPGAHSTCGSARRGIGPSPTASSTY